MRPTIRVWMNHRKNNPWLKPLSIIVKVTIRVNGCQLTSYTIVHAHYRQFICPCRQYIHGIDCNFNLTGRLVVAADEFFFVVAMFMQEIGTYVWENRDPDRYTDILLDLFRFQKMCLRVDSYLNSKIIGYPVKYL